MKTIVLETPGKLSLIRSEFRQTISAHSALIKVRRVAICGTDLHAFKGQQPFFSYPRILGHEIAGEVVEVGSKVTHLKAGDYCAIEPYRNLSEDQAVKRGKTNCGKDLSVLGVHEDGAMQEFIVCDANLIHPVNDLELDHLALIEPLSIGRHAIVRANIQQNDTVLIVGVGPIGYGVLMQCIAKKHRVAVLDSNPERLAFVQKNFPDIPVLNLTDKVIAELEAAFDGELPTIVLDATGSKESMENSFNYAAAGGSIVFVGLFMGSVTFDDPNFHKKELTLKASRNATKHDFQFVINALRNKEINLDGYISQRIKFLDTPEEFEGLFHKEVMKAIIDFD